MSGTDPVGDLAGERDGPAFPLIVILSVVVLSLVRRLRGHEGAGAGSDPAEERAPRAATDSGRP
ncbi:hypothetical protein [Allosalinactinospora lopnorensis]|uniref:hypothetical protein n=1 Tax=Allosalinactinospora lopnorensis TaxID=1352348 RepID=UPI000623CCFF|nr:hypothetical protein [Allosalinactinospora lopnorensis]